MGEAWNTTRGNNGTWEEVNGSPKKKDMSQLVMPEQFAPCLQLHIDQMMQETPLSLHHARQRQAAAAQAAALSTPPKPGQFSPQRYENNLGKDSGASRYTTATSPNFGSAANGGYDSVVDNELALGLRGMVVEDDYNSNQQYRQQAAGSQSQPTLQVRVPMQQARGPYNGYAQTEYSAYYPNSNGMEYAYPYTNTADPSLYASAGLANGASANMYSGVSPQTMHASAVADFNRQQPGLFYDYTAQARPPGSQYYYPAHQTIMYPTMHSPMPTPQLSAATPATLSDKKRDLQVCFLADCRVWSLIDCETI